MRCEAKAALQAAKKRGQRLGNPNLAKAAKRGTAAVKANARRFAANVRPIIDEIMRAGATSHNAIAAKLNERNVRTARGGVWTHVQVGPSCTLSRATAQASPWHETQSCRAVTPPMITSLRKQFCRALKSVH